MISTEEQIRYWLSLTVVPKMGIKGLLKSALAAQVSLSKLHSISREKLSDIGWKDEQIACLTEAHPFTQKCIR